MAGYWPLVFCLWTETNSEARSINTQIKERGQRPAVLKEQAWSIKELLYAPKLICVLIYLQELKGNTVACKKMARAPLSPLGECRNTVI